MCPPHQVTIAVAFYIGRTEVSNGQYKKFIAETGYEDQLDTDPACEGKLLLAVVVAVVS